MQLLHIKYMKRQKYCSGAKYSLCWALRLAWNQDQNLG